MNENIISCYIKIFFFLRFPVLLNPFLYFHEFLDIFLFIFPTFVGVLGGLDIVSEILILIPSE